MTYFNYPSMGVPNNQVVDEVQTFLRELPYNIKNHQEDYSLELVKIVENTRKKIADCYRVPEQNIAFIANTTEGLGMIASALGASNLQVNVAIPDIEFISSAQVWQEHANKIMFCDTTNGKVPVNGINDTLNKGSNILCMSSIQEVSGYRFPFQQLLQLRQKNEDEFWIIDGIQESGVLGRDLLKDRIDAYIVGGHKWLNSPFGLGFMFISNRLLERIHPSYLGYFNLTEPEDGWVKYLESRKRSLKDLKFMQPQKGATIFESGGMVNAIGAFIIGRSIDEWEAFGIEEASDHIYGLQSLFRTRIEARTGMGTLSDDSKYSWSSIVTLTMLDYKKEKQLFQKLSKQGIKVSFRSIEGIGGIRFGFHYTTEVKEVEELVETIIELCKTP